MKKLMLALTALSLLGGAAAPAFAAPCKDKQGRFVKCPVVKVAAKPKVCRNAQGHFMKCPPAKPAKK